MKVTSTEYCDRFCTSPKSANHLRKGIKKKPGQPVLKYVCKIEDQGGPGARLKLFVVRQKNSLIGFGCGSRRPFKALAALPAANSVAPELLLLRSDYS